MMNNDDIKFLLVKYITNQASEAEAKEVKHWIGLHPENELYFVELYEAWQNLLYTKPETIDTEKAYQQFLAKTITPQKQPVSMWRFAKVAAVVCFFLLSALWLIYHRSGTVQKGNQVVAQNGAVKKIILSDGTTIWLNAGSTIKYDAGFGKTNRSIYLEGEAFFDIGHNNSKHLPFLVNTKKYTIRDIGTKFNLKAYPNDPFFETTVVKGEVAVESNADNGTHEANRIYVKPSQVLKIFYRPEKADSKELISMSNTYNEVQVSQVDSAKIDVYDGWKDDLLVFDGNTLGDIAHVLERRYNVTINIDSQELKDIRYSGCFKNVPDIDKVLHLIKQNTPISYTIDGQKITITKTN
jgi:transmembrane sensor